MKARVLSLHSAKICLIQIGPSSREGTIPAVGANPVEDSGTAHRTGRRRGWAAHFWIDCALSIVMCLWFPCVLHSKILNAFRFDFEMTVVGSREGEKVVQEGLTQVEKEVLRIRLAV
jgi:hypothetical protein